MIDKAKLDDLYLASKAITKTAGESSKRADARFDFNRIVWENWGEMSYLLRRLEAAERYIEHLEIPFAPGTALVTAGDAWRSLKEIRP